MISELKDTYSYQKVITLISVLSFVFGVATCFLGELLLPVASSFLAILFLFEKPNKRILSYACPLAAITVSVFLAGVAAIITVEYVILALIIAFCYKKALTKAETAIYTTLTVSIFVFISLYLSGALAIESFAASEVKKYYVEAFYVLKEEFVEVLSGFTVTSNDGTVQNMMTVEDATLYFKAISTTFIALVAIFGFLISGLTLKMYSSLVLRYSKHGILKKFAHFIPSNFAALVYIISSILSALSSDTSKFGIVLLNCNVIMTAVFGYMGLRYLLMIIKASQRRSLAFCLLIAAFISLPSVTPTIISYLGVWVVLGTNSHNKASNT